MTYCVALCLDAGLVFLSDTRTNAGLDNISRFKKMHNWEVESERAITIMTAGNLAITQAVITRLQKNIDNKEIDPEYSILTCSSMFRVAELTGEAMLKVQNRYGKVLSARGESSDAMLILGGQRKGGELRLFLVYSAGNFIEATVDTPYFQIGEHKYGKPILDRIISPDTPLSDALKAVFVSMDSTIRSNLSVGMPLDLAVQKKNALAFDKLRRVHGEDADFQNLSEGWSEALRLSFKQLPNLDF